MSHLYDFSGPFPITVGIIWNSLNVFCFRCSKTLTDHDEKNQALKLLLVTFDVKFSLDPLARNGSTIMENICWSFHILAQFLFITSKKELNCYHQSVTLRVASRVAEQLKNYVLRKLVHFKEILEMLWIGGQYLASHQKRQILLVLLQHRKKSTVKYSIVKPSLRYFFGLSTIFCPRLSE